MTISEYLLQIAFQTEQTISSIKEMYKDYPGKAPDAFLPSLRNLVEQCTSEALAFKHDMETPEDYAKEYQWHWKLPRSR